MSPHIVARYDQELKELTGRIAEMGGLAEGQIAEAISALVRGDTKLAHKVIQTDARIDALQREVEEQAIQVIARRQPMAVDLRHVFAALRIAGDLERIGDLAKSIAKRAVVMGGAVQVKRLAIGVEHLAETALDQLKSVLDAYTAGDADRARDVRERDDQIDALYTSLFRELLTYMMEDPRNITFCTHLLFCAKNVERIGDHATNIAEAIWFEVTGEQVTEERPKANDVGQMQLGDGA
ncbi:MAG: phosphate signaling complex protein PhoU [Siculibacillus sp.]